MHSLIIYDNNQAEEFEMESLELIETIVNLKEMDNSDIKFELNINIEYIDLKEYQLLMKLILNGQKDEIIDNFKNKYDLDEWVYVWSVLSYCIKKSI